MQHKYLHTTYLINKLISSPFTHGIKSNHLYSAHDTLRELAQACPYSFICYAVEFHLQRTTYCSLNGLCSAIILYPVCLKG